MKVFNVKKASFSLLAGALFFILTASIFGQNMFRKVNDFDGDGKADYVVTRTEGELKTWHIWQSNGEYRVFQWGLRSDKEASGDYDGDGKTDIAVLRQGISSSNTTASYLFVYRISTNTWYYKYMPYFATSDTVEPVVQDYDGDGKAEEAHFYKNQNGSGLIVIRESLVTSNTRTFDVSSNQSVLRLGDLNGNGSSEFIYLDRTNNNLKITDYTAGGVQNIQFGIPGDQFVPADFDGDGKGDIAVFRESNGTWWWRRSSDNVVQAAQFGQNGDKPVPADYDGDGKTDLAIWRPGDTQSVYWVYGSLGNITVVPFGIGTDKVVTY